jgi:hypothetical protein
MDPDRKRTLSAFIVLEVICTATLVVAILLMML